jgi:cytochrome c-type biogenesis protein CcmH
MAFWVIAALLAVGALAFVLPPLLGSRRAGSIVTADETNVALYRDQLKELDADLAAGTLNPERHEEARREIERRLLDDVRAAAAPSAKVSGRATAVAVGIAVPIAAILLYFAVGNPAALAPGAGARDDHAVTRERIEDMVGRLAARMKEQPDDVDGWVMLGRSYAVLDRHAEAAAAYANAVKRSPPNAQLLADYADTLAMSQGRTLQGEPERLIEQALKVDPDNVKALALAGTVAFQKHDFKRAIGHWERILKVVPPDSEIAEAVRDSIADARKVAGGKQAPAPPKPGVQPVEAGVSGTVRLAPALAAKAAPGDTVFIFARPVTGPRMPLAVMRKQVRDLPAAFTLDDSMAMTPASKLSAHEQVVVGARVSKSGSPAPQPGDLEGLSAPVKAGHTGITIVIDREIAAANPAGK